MRRLLTLLLLAGCASQPAVVREVGFGHSSGGPASISTHVTVRSNGEIELASAGDPIVASIGIGQATALIDRMHSEQMQSALAPFRGTNTCCDREVVYFNVDGVMTTAAVYGDGEDIVIPRELLDVLARVDRLARAKFGMLYGYRLMPQR